MKNNYVTCNNKATWFRCLKFKQDEVTKKKNRWNMLIESRYITFILKSLTEWQDAYNSFNIYLDLFREKKVS